MYVIPAKKVGCYWARWPPEVPYSLTLQWLYDRKGVSAMMVIPRNWEMCSTIDFGGDLLSITQGQIQTTKDLGAWNGIYAALKDQSPKESWKFLFSCRITLEELKLHRQLTCFLYNTPGISICASVNVPVFGSAEQLRSRSDLNPE